MHQQMNITKVKTHISAIVNQQNTTYVTKDGHFVAAIVPYQEYKALYRAWKEKERNQSKERAQDFHKGEGDFVPFDKALKALGR